MKTSQGRIFTNDGEFYDDVDVPDDPLGIVSECFFKTFVAWKALHGRRGNGPMELNPTPDCSGAMRIESVVIPTSAAADLQAVSQMPIGTFSFKNRTLSGVCESRQSQAYDATP